MDRNLESSNHFTRQALKVLFGNVHMIIAHRGYSALYLENSMESFRMAKEAGADMIEMDLHLTSDQHLIIMHDATTGRTAMEDLRIADVTLKRLKGLVLKNGESIPTLEEALGLLQGGLPLNLELKAKGTGAALARFLQGSRPPSDLLVSSFSSEEIDAFRRSLPHIPVARVYNRITTKDLRRDAEAGSLSVHVNRARITPELVKEAHHLGLRVLVFTVDDPHKMVELFSVGVDGVFTNDPVKAMEVAKVHGFR